MLVPRIKLNHHTDIPMLVIGAENDSIFSVKENQTTAKKYNAHLHIVPDMAHDMMLDQHYDRAAEVVLEWLGRSD